MENNNKHSVLKSISKSSKQIIAGILSILMALSAAASPIMAFAASGSAEAVPDLESVRGELNDDEIVQVSDYTISVGDDIDIKTDFTGISYDSEKLKVELIDDGGFDSGKAGEYSPAYYATPSSGNPKYSFTRKIIVKEQEGSTKSSSSAASGTSSGSGEEQAAESEEESSDSDNEEGQQEETAEAAAETEKEAEEPAEKDVSDMTDEEVEEAAYAVFDKMYEGWDESQGKEYVPTEREEKILQRYDAIVNPVRALAKRRLMATTSLPSSMKFDHTKNTVSANALPSDFTDAGYINKIAGSNTMAFCVTTSYSTNKNISYTKRAWKANAFYSALAYCYRYAPKQIGSSNYPAKYKTGNGVANDYWVAREAMRKVIYNYTGTWKKKTVDGAVIEGAGSKYPARNNAKSKKTVEMVNKLYTDALAAGKKMNNGYSNNMSITVTAPSNTALFYDKGTDQYWSSWYKVSSEGGLGTTYSVTLSGNYSTYFKVNNDSANNRFYISIPAATLKNLAGNKDFNTSLTITVKQNVSRDWVYIYYPANQSKNKLQSVLVGGEDTQTASATAKATAHYAPSLGNIRIKKSSAAASISDANADAYSLSGTVYTVYTDSGCTKEAGKLTTDESGQAVLSGLTAGTYYVKETTAPKGYKADTQVYTVTVTAGGTADVNGSNGVKETPVSTTFKLTKQDRDSGALLSGAVFTVKYYASDDESDTASKTWLFKTDENGTISFDSAHYVSGDSLYTDASGNPGIPVGTVTVQETEAPEGYDLNKTVFKGKSKSDGTFAWASVTGSDSVSGDAVTVKDAPKALESVLTAAGNSHYSPASSSVTLTDEVSYYGLETGKEYTLSGKLVDSDGKDITVGGKALTAQTTFTPDAANGTVKQEFTFDATSLGGKDVIAYEYVKDGDDTVRAHEDPTDAAQTVHFPKITTSAYAYQGSAKTKYAALEGPGTTLEFYDTVNYENLEPGKEYTLTGEVVYTLNTPDDNHPAYMNNNNKKVTATATFTPESSEGSEIVTFSIPLEENKTYPQIISSYGGLITVYETLSQNGTVYASHKQYGDEAQQLSIFGAYTQLHEDGKATTARTIQASGTKTLADRVNMFGVKAGTTYTVYGVLIDKATGDPVTDKNGDDVSVYKTFTTETGDAYDDIVSQNLTYTLENTQSLVGKSLVSYVYIYEGKVSEEDASDTDDDAYVPVFSEENLDDTKQTVWFPGGKTTATDTNTKTHNGKAEKEASITDRVTYTSLWPGHSYTVTGTLMDKETGKVIQSGGKDVTAEQTFTAAAENGYVDLTFTFDASTFAGKSVVAFETVKDGDSEVFVHADINDADQTVSYPSVRTNAVDTDTTTHTGTVSKAATVKDAVTYSGLTVGKSYTVKGTLYNKETGKAIQSGGKDVTSELTFTAEKESGSVELTFTLDSSALAGKSVVAFEDLYQDGVELSAHADINDTDQTVNYPDISTQAQDSETKDQQGKNGSSVKVIDKVSYTNVTVGETYYVKGTLMDKSSGKAVKDGSGQDITVSSDKFKAESANGTIDVTFTLDSTKLSGNTAVAYQDLYTVVDDKDHLVVAHDDINDDAEAVFYSSIKTNAADQDTKDNTGTVAEKAVVTDVVTYENLIVGKSYTIKGTLMDKETGKALTDASGNEITASQEFTPTAKNGSVTLTFTLDSTLLSGKSVVAFEDLYHNGIKVATHSDINDEDQTVHYPEVKTNASDAATRTRTGAVSDKSQVTDVVTYTNLIVGKSYTIKGTLMDKETGKAIQSEGKDVTAETTFTPDKADGSVTLTFTLDSTALSGKSVVAFEDLYHENVKVATHSDLTDEDQTVNYPAVKTKAKDALTGDQTGTVSKQGSTVKVTDTVTYENLIVGRTYIVKGTLVDRGSNKELAKAQSEAFTPEKPDGDIDVVFTLDTSSMAGHTAVAYETLAVVTGAVPNEEEGGVHYTATDVVKHENPDDKDELIFYPSVRTNASDKDNSTHSGTVSKTATVTDVVTYENLIVGKSYTIKGTLMDKETGKALTDASGNTITAEKTFTADKADGSIELSFTLDSTLLEGKSVVTFEDLQHNGKTVVVHEDINDKDQTVYYPSIKTVAADTVTAGHSGRVITNDDKKEPLKDEAVEDTVSLSNLVSGCTYKVSGTLVDKETGKAVKDKDGKDAAAQLTFKAGSDGYKADADGNTVVKLSFDIDASALSGKSVVAFEKLYVTAVPGTDSEGKETDTPLDTPKEVGKHEDLTDEDQTIHYPEVKTNASDAATRTRTGVVSDKSQVTDVVTYTNLIVGKSYTVKGTLYNKETGKAVQSDGKDVTAETTFTADKADGSVTLTFTLDSTALEGKSVVAFEDLYHENVKVATHSDINDEDQTVHYPEVKTNASDAATRTRTGVVSDKSQVTDVVTYTNLIVGKSYTVKGTLYNKETGKAVQSDGKDVTAETTFTADKADGSVTLTFTLDSTALEGKSVVAFEDLYHENVKVATHSDLTDEDQTVRYPKVRTTATEKTTGTHTGVSVGKTTIVDSVSYNNLIPGKTYTVKGTLYNKETGKPFIGKNGKPITAEKTFTVPEAAKSEENTEAQTKEDEAAPAVSAQARLETAIEEAKKAQGADITVPRSSTAPAAGHSDEGSSSAQESAEESVTEKEAAQESAGVSGTVQLSFEADASLFEGKTAVAFEDLYDGDVKAATHSDINDEGQSVYYPAVKTKATIDSKKSASASGTKTVKDNVSYTNLTPGKSYTVKGTLMDKSSGKAFKDADGKDVTSEATFTADKKSGSVELMFTFNAQGLSKTTIVAFEDLYEGDVKIATHADLTDADQTVTIKKPSSTAPGTPESPSGSKKVKTGDTANTVIWIVIVACAAGAIILAVCKRKAKK